MAALVDTNILVYRYDFRFRMKQEEAVRLLREGLELGTLFLPHQAILEFVAATGRPRPDLDGRPLLTREEAHREAGEMLVTFPILYPTEEVVHLAFQGAATFGLSWFDAHLWAYAEAYGISEILSEDFEDGRYYGGVRVRNPFSHASVLNEPPATGYHQG